jgi:hypothetical protein
LNWCTQNPWSLSTKIAHSNNVTPCFNISSFISLSRVSSLSLASARRCSWRRIPRIDSTGAICSSDGWQDARTPSMEDVDEDRLLIGAGELVKCLVFKICRGELLLVLLLYLSSCPMKPFLRGGEYFILCPVRALISARVYILSDRVGLGSLARSSRLTIFPAVFCGLRALCVFSPTGVYTLSDLHDCETLDWLLRSVACRCMCMRCRFSITAQRINMAIDSLPFPWV